MKLPNGDRAIVPLAKLADYALNPAHKIGKHKARVFASVLGLNRADAEFLRGALLDAARTGEAVEADATEYGQLYTLDFKVTTLQGTATVRSGWIVPLQVEIPQLTSVYVLLK